MTRLSDYLNDANKNAYSARKISDLAKDKGVSVHHGTINEYLKGRHTDSPTKAPLKAFSVVLGLPIDKLEKLAAEKLEQEPFILPPSANALTRKEREVILRMVEVLTDNKQQAQEPEPSHPEQSGLALAAYDADLDFLERRRRDETRGEESQISPYDED